MFNFNFDISAFLGSSNSKNSFMNSFNFSDYASIKNGSYGKLVKSYYNVNNEDKKSSSKADSTSKTKKEDKTETSGLSMVKKESDGLKNAVDTLGSDDTYKATAGSVNMQKIATAVKDFADKYNDVLSQSAKVNSKDISSNIRSMKSLTDTMSKGLAKIGINVGSDGKLSVNEDTVKNADISTIKSYFKNSYSYGSQIADMSNNISKAAVLGSSTYSDNGTLNSNISGLFDGFI